MSRSPRRSRDNRRSTFGLFITRAGYAFVLPLFACAIPSCSATEALLQHYPDCGVDPRCRERPDSVGVRVRGRLMVEGPTGPQPLPFTRILLKRKAATVATSASDRDGSFQFPRGVPCGIYDLTLDSDRHQAHVAFEHTLTTSRLLVTAAVKR